MRICNYVLYISKQRVEYLLHGNYSVKNIVAVLKFYREDSLIVECYVQGWGHIQLASLGKISPKALAFGVVHRHYFSFLCFDLSCFVELDSPWVEARREARKPEFEIYILTIEKTLKQKRMSHRMITGMP